MRRTADCLDGGRDAGLDFAQVLTISRVMEFTENRRAIPRSADNSYQRPTW